MSPADLWNAMDARFTQIFPDIKVPAGPLTEAELDAALSRQDAPKATPLHGPHGSIAFDADGQPAGKVKKNCPPPSWMFQNDEGNVDAQPEQQGAVDVAHALEVLRVVTSRAMQGSETREAFEVVKAALAARQPVGQEPVAYLDIGAGGYTDVGSDLTAEQLALLPKGRHMLAIIGTYGVDGYVAAPDQRAAQAEQQGAGDARAQFEAWAAGRGWKLSPYQNNCGIVVSEKYGHPGVQRCWEAWQAALAARQPAGQEPAAYMVRWKTAGGFGLVRLQDMKYYHDRHDEHEIVPLYREVPPAQVDLEQFRESVIAEYDGAAAIVSEFPDFSGVEERTCEERLAIPRAKRDRLLALIDQQAGGEG